MRKNGQEPEPRWVQIKQSAVEVTSNHAVVTLPVDELKDNNKAVLYWFAYTTPKINPLITKAVEEIFAQQTLTKPVCLFTHTHKHTSKQASTQTQTNERSLV